MRLAYADPPYPGKAHLYRGEPSYAGEVDHRALVASLLEDYDGWALSTSAAGLRVVLPLIPSHVDVHVCPWVKPRGVSSAGNGLQNAWEPVIVRPARELPPGFRDWLYAMPARRGGTLIGRKPLAFCGFLFRALGAASGDHLEDLFPGTGIVGRAWRAFCNASPRALGDASSTAANDASPAAAGDASPQDLSDVSAAGIGDGSRVAMLQGRRMGRL